MHVQSYMFVVRKSLATLCLLQNHMGRVGSMLLSTGHGLEPIEYHVSLTLLKFHIFRYPPLFLTHAIIIHNP